MIQSFENFLDLNNKVFVYALIYSMFNVEITLKICKLFEFLTNYKNCFNLKNAKILFKYKNKDHVIDLILDAKSLYKSFYILSKSELNVLKDYSLKNLILNRIRDL